MNEARAPRTRRSAEHATDAVLTVQEVSRITGLSGWTLRYYEKIGLIDPVARDASSGHRAYTRADLARIESLAHLRAAGLAIEEMRALMAARGHTPETVAMKIEMLAAHSQALEEEMRRLAARKRYIDNRVAYWRAVQAGDDAEAARLETQGRFLGEKLS
ncbi:MerR family transcriptional regulator [Actinacidiphila guanduensis]|uniref:DNA-binding transcriptional regulator, MerR family n=1 Tax=Actinacidiphila guanduensis TaxID=310781 RepID=A0A1H0LB69_9ACTN|nr:MerR family transcriptional regulator [Actinacidiphila guanduensis]SDO65499.1 DNA-binding transcriptional regulator, MerR family [Actinacidiphila guanduensis]